MSDISFVNAKGGLLPEKEVRRVQKQLEKVDPDLRKSLAKDLRTDLKPVSSKIVSDFPASPLSGMDARWGNVTAKIVTNSMARPGKALALFSVKANPGSFARLLSITERAGSRSDGFIPQGEAMIRTLQQRHPLDGKGGRFVFKSFREQLGDIRGIARDAIDRFTTKLNRSK